MLHNSKDFFLFFTSNVSGRLAGIALGLGLQPNYFEGERAGQAQSYWSTRVIHYPPLAEGTTHRSTNISKQPPKAEKSIEHLSMHKLMQAAKASWRDEIHHHQNALRMQSYGVHVSCTACRGQKSKVS